ncbi:MAG: glycosyltransferase family 2 protein, partial [Actinomycetota bacterium]
MVDVSVLLVTYNSREAIGDCLSSLSRVEGCAIEILVADNASSDGTPEFVRRGWPEARVFPMEANLGFARANNRLIARASGRHLMLLNPDTVVDPQVIARLMSFLDGNPRSGVAAPRLVNPDLTDQQTARSFPTPAAALLGRRSPLTRAFPNNRWSRRYLSGRDRSGSEPFEVDWVSGAALMVPGTVIDEVGPLDESFFMYWEDADWCRRIKAAGFGVFCVPAARVVHDEGVTNRSLPARQVWQFHRSAYRYYAKHHLPGALRWLRVPAGA